MHSLSFLQRTYFILTPSFLLASSSTMCHLQQIQFVPQEYKQYRRLIHKSLFRQRVILQIIILLLIKQTAMTIPLLELLENPAKWQQRRIERLNQARQKFGRLVFRELAFPSSKERASFSLSPSVFCLFFVQARALLIACNQSHLVPQDFSRREKKI